MSLTLEEMVGSMALCSWTRLPFLQKVRLARGSNNPGSVQQQMTSGPIFSVTTNLTIPPSTRSSSPTFISVVTNHTIAKYQMQNQLFYSLKFQQIKTRGTLKERKILQENKHCTFSKAIIIDTNCPFKTIGTKRPYSEGPNFTILQNMSNRLLLVPNKLK